MSTTTITSLTTKDLRFPTSDFLDGSDAIHTDPDYSCAYVILGTDRADGLEGHGLTFSLGRGCVQERGGRHRETRRREDGGDKRGGAQDVEGEP
jgi:hypothetical protein